MSKEVMENEKFCGTCVHFKYEDIEGWGQCVFTHCGMSHCSDLCTAEEHYATEEEKRHYLAVLRQLNRYRRDDNVPSIYRMPDPKEVGKAIDFLVEYSKLY
jgi:hypothetical protein